jgi:hypothetical protein
LPRCSAQCRRLSPQRHRRLAARRAHACALSLVARGLPEHAPANVSHPGTSFAPYIGTRGWTMFSHPCIGARVFSRRLHAAPALALLFVELLLERLAGNVFARFGRAFLRLQCCVPMSRQRLDPAGRRFPSELAFGGWRPCASRTHLLRASTATGTSAGSLALGYSPPRPRQCVSTSAPGACPRTPSAARARLGLAARICGMHCASCSGSPMLTSSWLSPCASSDVPSARGSLAPRITGRALSHQPRRLATSSLGRASPAVACGPEQSPHPAYSAPATQSALHLTQLRAPAQDIFWHLVLAHVHGQHGRACATLYCHLQALPQPTSLPFNAEPGRSHTCRVRRRLAEVAHVSPSWTRASAPSRATPR